MNYNKLPPLAKQFMTRTELFYEHRIPYSVIADRVRRGELELRLIDGKIQVNVEEALRVCQSKRPSRKAKTDLFA